MCGIIGYVGERPCLDVLLGGLERLEYRGYDSAGVALIGGDKAVRVRSVGGIAQLREAVGSHSEQHMLRTSTTGIGHTRWATHGRVSEANAHPLTDDRHRVQIVLNGIVENHAAVRAELEEEGASFASDTDAEVVAQLVGRALDRGLADAVRVTAEALEGHFAFVVASSVEPDLLVGTRRACPLVIGRSVAGRFLGSALVGLPRDAREASVVGDGDLVVLRSTSTRVSDRRGRRMRLQRLALDGKRSYGHRNGHESFMLAEIDEQPQALERTLASLQVEAPLQGTAWTALRNARRLTIVACGTSYHAGLVGRFLLERWAGLQVEVDIASEWRYRDPDVERGDTVLGVTQSGETADTVEALRLARRDGAHALAITNAPESQVTREVDASLLTDAGFEVSVAATKTFVTQVAALAWLALRLGVARGVLDNRRAACLAEALAGLPGVAAAVRARVADPVALAADRWAEAPFFLYLGRQIDLPVALEGALKLKEIAYIPTDAYAAGEMKHGPIALLTEDTPVVCVATARALLGKLRANLAEVRARGARVLAVATDEAADEIAGEADELLLVPDTEPELTPIATVVPLQLLAYRIARARGLDVDRPRNLAKTVTVE